MDSTFAHQIRTAIDKLKENNFQDFITELLIKKYGHDFTPIKQKRDKGCDGIIENRLVIAVYAPERNDLTEFKRKIGEDYQKYKTNWSAYPEWCVIYNGEFTASRVQFINGLEPDIQKWDINHIAESIHELQWVKIRGIAAYLGINEQYYINDVLKNVIDDLLKDSSVQSHQVEIHKKPPYIEDKIELNYDNSDVQDAINEYEVNMPFITELDIVLKTYSDDEISSLKSKVVNIYNKLSGDFKTRLNNLTDDLAERNGKDDVYKSYVRAVLIYFFEICLIGKKVEVAT